MKRSREWFLVLAIYLLSVGCEANTGSGASSIVSTVRAVDPCPRWSTTDPCVVRERLKMPPSHLALLGLRGRDDRVNVECLKEPPPGEVNPRSRGRSTPAIFRREAIEGPDGEVRLDPAIRPLAQLDAGDALCPDEVFSSEPRGALCGAVLVGERKVLSSAHCFVTEDMDEFRIVFGFSIVDGDSGVTHELTRGSICTIEPATWTRIGKLALFDITCPEGFVTPPVVPLASTDPRVDDPVYGIGYPMFLPAKYTGVERVEPGRGTDFFSANFDISPGYSGSPIFNEKHELVGIVESDGSADTCYDRRRGCRRWYACKRTCGTPVKILPIGAIKGSLGG